MKPPFRDGTWERATFACFVVAVLLAAVGIIAFPYPPDRIVGGSFLDKLGQPHSAECHWWFVMWERTILVVGLTMWVLVVGSHIRRFRQTGAPSTPTPPA